MSDNQATTGHVDPSAGEPPRSPLRLLFIIALMLGAVLVFGSR